MAHAPLGVVMRHIHTLTGAATARRLTDSHLLCRFAETRDEDALAELMRRHGPLVLSMCRRILGHEQDAEDAFQAAFLVLARKAGSIRKGESVGSFLHGVAYRIAMKERGKLAQRRQREQQIESRMPADPVYEAAFRELQMLLDEGLNHLAEKYRTPFVLCCLEGKSKSEAAHELGWKEGTVSSRLAQARKQLQQFLSRKGVTLTAVLTAAGIAENTANACVPPLLAASTVRAASQFAFDSSAAMATVQAVQLAEKMLRSMAALPWKTATALLMVVSLAVGGAGMAFHDESAKQIPASETPKTKASVAGKPAREQEKPRTDRYGDPLPEGALARLGTIRFRQGFFTRQVAFSPDGKMVACAGAGRGVCLWDVATGKELRQIGRKPHADTLAFSPDGKMIACSFQANLNSETALYVTENGRKIAELSPKRAISLAFAPDGKTIAGLFGLRSGIQFFDAATGAKQKREALSGDEDIYRMAWSPDSKKLAWLGQNGSVHLWDAIEAKEVGQWKAHEKDVISIDFSPDGKTLATGSPDGTVRLWDIATRDKKHTLDGKHPQVRSIIFSRDGRLLASGHSDGTIALWDASKGKEIRCWRAHCFPVSSLDFSADDKTLVSGAIWECGPRLWDVETGAEVRPLAGHTAPVERIFFSQDGKHILSMGREKKILDWNPTNGRETLRFQWRSGPSAGVWDQLILSPRGDVVASWGHDDGTIRLWDAVTGKKRSTLGKFPNRAKDSGFLIAMEFSLDGQMLAVGTKDGMVWVWDVDAGVVQQQLKGLAGQILCTAFSRDGQKIAAGTARGSPTMALWDVKTGKSLAKFSNTERVDRLTFSQDGKTLASASWVEKATRLWDAATGNLIRPCEETPGLYDIAFSPDGKWLAGAGEDQDQKVHIWEVNTGLKVREFRGHSNAVMSVAFAPDGRTLASGGGDSSILLWDFTGRIKDGRFQIVKWTPRELEKRWIDLASSAGPQAVQALWDLVASPGQTVPLLRQRIKPVESADAQRVERLIRDLDSEDFQTRTKATEELEKIVDGAEPALRQKLAEKPSLEMRQRIQQVLSRLEPSASGERLRALRAIQVLEYMGTPEAREHLRALANGFPEARLTREAKAALERLAK
jgi:RNA polymerase sigma factor (sigma-70 family)